MVYLIDDDKSVRRGFESFLESNAMEYRSSESLEEFLSLYKPDENDLIVLDLNLPGMKGTDLFIKLNESGLKIPVIVVTAFDDVQSRELCKKYGIKEFLRKPVDAEALIDLIKYNT